MAKILTARQAVDTYFYDGATVTFGGFANGLMHPEEIMVALEEAARSSGHPRGLRVVYASGQGDSGERGLNHLAVDGMCTTVIGGHWGLAPKLGGLAAENKLAAYNLPQGVISGLFREIAAKRPGVITHVGLDTFVDPRLEGGKMNRAAHEAGDMVKLIELEGEEKLFYPAFPIDIAVIRATYADERGNCTFEREGVYAEALAQAQAAHNSGGRVIVQVEKVVSYGCLDARLIRLPGIYVDALVVARPENHMQTFGTQYDPAFSGEIRTPLNALVPAADGCAEDHCPAGGHGTDPLCSDQSGHRHAGGRSLCGGRGGAGEHGAHNRGGCRRRRPGRRHGFWRRHQCGLHSGAAGSIRLL